MKFVEFTLSITNRKIMIDPNLIQGLEGDEKGCTLYVNIDAYREHCVNIEESYEQAVALLKGI